MVEERGAAHPELAPSGLSGDEAANLAEWAGRYGTLHQTREPAPGDTLTRLWPVAIPLAEEFDRRGVSGLRFRRWLIAEGRD